MPQTWLTSDTHIGHLNIIAYSLRPFYHQGYSQADLVKYLKSLDYTDENGQKIRRKPNPYELRNIVDLRSHDQALLDNWNSVVKPGDTVYHLGDFGFGDFENYLRRLNGNIILIKGNHDQGVERHSKLFQHIWYEAPLNRGVKIDNEKVVLCHYPQLSWNAAFHGRLHFFGHVHTSPLKKYICARNSYDVGVDNNNYTPISFEDACDRARNNKDILTFSTEGSRETVIEETTAFDLIEL